MGVFAIESIRPRTKYVIGPDGSPLTIADLPTPGTKRWVIRRKAEVVAAVRGGLLSLEEACSRYMLTVDEFLSWQHSIDQHGLAGLRSTRTQQYRQKWSFGKRTAKAEAYFERALAMARKQPAKSWELRAAMTMRGFWRDLGKPQQAHELLAPVYGWFTEGFDTLDLKEAEALLDELHAWQPVSKRPLRQLAH
jgi:hypothetical protein